MWILRFVLKNIPPSEKFQKYIFDVFRRGGGGTKPNVKLTFFVASLSLDGSPKRGNFHNLCIAFPNQTYLIELFD